MLFNKLSKTTRCALNTNSPYGKSRGRIFESQVTLWVTKFSYHGYEVPLLAAFYFLLPPFFCIFPNYVSRVVVLMFQEYPWFSQNRADLLGITFSTCVILRVLNGHGMDMVLYFLRLSLENLNTHTYIEFQMQKSPITGGKKTLTRERLFFVCFSTIISFYTNPFQSQPEITVQPPKTLLLEMSCPSLHNFLCSNYKKQSTK